MGDQGQRKVINLSTQGMFPFRSFANGAASNVILLFSNLLLMARRVEVAIIKSPNRKNSNMIILLTGGRSVESSLWLKTFQNAKTTISNLSISFPRNTFVLLNCLMSQSKFSRKNRIEKNNEKYGKYSIYASPALIVSEDTKVE